MGAIMSHILPGFVGKHQKSDEVNQGKWRVESQTKAFRICCSTELSTKDEVLQSCQHCQHGKH